ncbi:MAG: thiosulfate oxidation carrier complex protein SoxZ [Gemmatimonadales bacterium]|nr:thiosulfate oxidation carrier complex protein SoxZ [Gemmatimonadales bacterium]
MRTTIGEARLRLPARIAKGDVIMVNAIVTHPMDTGFFRTPEGQPIPAFFVKDVVVRFGGAEVARFEWTSGISRDPVVSFPLLADREGTLEVTWTDSQGSTFTQQVPVAFGAA